MLEARSLTKYYGALPALRNATFTARPGQILGYLGPNGSGKSTTVRMLVGLMTPTTGDVAWHGRSIFEDLPAFRRVVGYVPEEPHLYTHLTAPEYLRLVGGLRDLDERSLGRKIDRLLDLLGLTDDRYAAMASFSARLHMLTLVSAWARSSAAAWVKCTM